MPCASYDLRKHSQKKTHTHKTFSQSNFYSQTRHTHLPPFSRTNKSNNKQKHTHKKNCTYTHCTEIAPPIVETTTAAPYVYTTVKPTARRKPHQNHKGGSKASSSAGNGPDGSASGRGRGQDGGAGGNIGVPNHIFENEIVVGMGSSGEGK